jgi:hypothetical protein
VRRIVGILTSIDIEPSPVSLATPHPTIGLGGLFRDVNLLLGDRAVDNTERPYADRPF